MPWTPRGPEPRMPHGLPPLPNPTGYSGGLGGSLPGPDASFGGALTSTLVKSLPSEPTSPVGESLGATQVGHEEHRPPSPALVRKSRIASALEHASEFKEHSVKIGNDPRLVELKHFLTSHTHQQRLLNRQETRRASQQLLDATTADSYSGKTAGRLAGTQDLDKAIKALASEGSPDLRIPARASSLAELGACRRQRDSGLKPPQQYTDMLDRITDGRHTTVDARLGWRECMDKTLQRLLVDLDFSLDIDRQHNFGHQSRCAHVERTHEWFVKHGQKEVKKEREGPSYLRFSEQDPVMAGSLRRLPVGKLDNLMRSTAPSQLRHGSALSKSASSPAFAAAGARVLGSNGSISVGSGASGGPPSRS